MPTLSLYAPIWQNCACDDGPKVRLSFIWASENIAVNTPDIFKDHMQIYAQLLHDTDTKVRMEAPEIFRVLGKRRPEFVLPFIALLENIAESDENRVVKIHCMGAVKAENLYSEYLLYTKTAASLYLPKPQPNIK